MSEYTDYLESKIYDIFPDDDDYYQELIIMSKQFRRFDEALDSFIFTHGYDGNLDDLKSKISFLKKKFISAGIKPPRNLEEWYTEYVPIERNTAIKLCFALELDENGAEDFLRRVCLQNSFDCHDPKELIYYFSLSHKITYQEAEKSISGINKAELSSFIMNDDAVYTSFIVEQIKEFEDLDEIVNYVRMNSSLFSYTNATASKFIITLWEAIASPAGIAAQEEKNFEISFEEECRGLNDQEKNKALKKNKRTASLWDIYLQILGLRGNLIKTLGTDRSLKPILENNPLLHPLAEASFPDRDGLTKILNGKHVSKERVRKTLILLAFYKYWGSLAVKKGDYYVEITENCAERCIAQIDNYLSEAGYPCLYPGNPFDWLILYASNDDQPLYLFRDFMRQMFYIKQDSDEIGLKLKKE